MTREKLDGIYRQLEQAIEDLDDANENGWTTQILYAQQVYESTSRRVTRAERELGEYRCSFCDAWVSGSGPCPCEG